MAGVAILVSLALLATGGLATGIARIITTENVFPGSDIQVTWNSITFATQWASPVVAVLLLTVIGLCWWQLQAWSELIESPDPDDDPSDALRHIRRAHLMARWTLVGVALTALGAVALFVSQVATYAGLTDGDCTLEISSAANMLAVFALLAAALWAGGPLGRHDDPAVGPIDAR